MKISYLIGSPKANNSFSERALNIVNDMLKESGLQFEEAFFNIHVHLLNESEMEEIKKSDILVVAFPLYVDGIPGHLLEQLAHLEEAFKGSCSAPVVYGIVNNGFIEARQNRFAAKSLQLFCKRSGALFGQVLCLGCGECINSSLANKASLECELLLPVGVAINKFVGNIFNKRSGDTLFAEPAIPANVFRETASKGYWVETAMHNGLTEADLEKKPALY